MKKKEKKVEKEIIEMDAPGAILRREREAKKLTLQDVAKETNINLQYLKALEEGNPDVFPGEVYFKGFLRSYANFLGLDAQEVISQYKESGLMEHSLEVMRPKVDVVSLLGKRRHSLFEQTRIWVISAIGYTTKMLRSKIFYIVLLILISIFIVWWFFSYEGVRL